MPRGWTTGAALAVAMLLASGGARAQDAALAAKWEARGPALAEKATRDCLAAARNRDACLWAPIQPCLDEIGGGVRDTAFCMGLGADTWTRLEQEAWTRLSGLLAGRPEALSRWKAERAAWLAWAEASVDAVHAQNEGTGALIDANRRSAEVRGRHALDLMSEIEILTQ